LVITNTSVNSAIMLVPAALVTPAISASNHLGIAYVVITYRPLPGVITANLDKKRVATALNDKMCRGVVEYAEGGMSYVVGSVAAELSTTGSIALVTGPMREASVTYHAYVREGFRTHCPACVLSSMYLETWVMANATLLFNALVDAGIAGSAAIDVVLLDVEPSVLKALKRAFEMRPMMMNISLLCMRCDDGVTVISFQSLPLFSALQQSFLTPPLSTAPSTYSFSLESGVGISVTLVCTSCISERALRTYADTATAITTLHDTYGVSGVERLLTLPLVIGDGLAPENEQLQILQSDSTSAWVPQLYKFSTDPSASVPLASVVNSTSAVSSATIASVDYVASVCTSCDLMEQLQLLQIDSEVECVALAVSQNLRHLSVMVGGTSEWVSPQRAITCSLNAQSWLAADARNLLPGCCFSVDAISSRQFIVFGGEHDTAFLPQARNDMFILTFDGGSSPATLADVILDLVVPSSTVIPAPRADHAHAVYVTADGIRKLFIHGGRGTGGAIFQDLWSYHTLDKTWVQLMSSPTSRYLHRFILSRRLDGDAVLIAWGGASLVPLETMEQYSLVRNVWFSVVSMPVASSSCAASLGPLHVAFLETTKLSPCVLDVLSLNHQCAAGDVATSASVSSSQIMCAAMKSASSPQQHVGLLVIPSTAATSSVTSMVMVPMSLCPAPYDLTTSANATTAAAPSSASSGSTADLAAFARTAVGVVASSASMSYEEYLEQCSASCPVRTIPYKSVCWPCADLIDLTSSTIYFPVWSRILPWHGHPKTICLS
jgi:hypothetical protein